MDVDIDAGPEGSTPMTFVAGDSSLKTLETPEANPPPHTGRNR